MTGPVERLFAEVVSTGLCARCGTCIAVCPEGCLEPAADLTPVCRQGCTGCSACLDSCPGRDLPMASLERRLFGRERDDGNELGAYHTVLAAHAIDPAVRSAGTSGGVVTALLVGLLESGDITGAIVTTLESTRPYRSVATIARDAASVRAAAQSKYSLTPQAAALRHAPKADRLAFVGLPCQIAGLRKAAVAGREFSQLTLAVGLCCLSSFYPEATTFIIEQVLGLHREDVERVAYRDGPFPGAFTVTTRTGQRHEVPYSEARAYFRMYRPYRCITCCDWSSELADVSVGDLFGDPNRDAYCSVLVRSEAGTQALLSAVAGGHLHVEPGDPAQILRNPGFLYKKRGNRAFISDARAHGLPTPTYPESRTSVGAQSRRHDKR